MSGDLVKAQVIYVVDGRAQSDRSSDIWCSALEFVGQVVVDGLFKGNRLDHLAATKEGRHGLQVLGLAVENTDAGRSE